MLDSVRDVPTRRLGLLFLLAACLGPSPSMASTAGGLDLSWSDCGSFGASQMSFACDNGGGRLVIVASAIAGAAMPQLNGQEAVLELQTSAGSVPPWWQFTNSGCRSASPPLISTDFNFTTASSCQDPWQGNAAGGLNYASGYQGPNRARIRTICAIPGSTSISGSDEYYFFKISISTARSGGASGCAGCADGACIVFDSILLTQPPGVGDHEITTPLERNYVRWQGGATSAGSGSGGGACSGATVQTVKTWGGLKSLYH